MSARIRIRPSRFLSVAFLAAVVFAATAIDAGAACFTNGVQSRVKPSCRPEKVDSDGVREPKGSKPLPWREKDAAIPASTGLPSEKSAAFSPASLPSRDSR